MNNILMDFNDDRPIDIPWPDEIRDSRAELEGLDEIDLLQLHQEISKIRLEVVKASRKRSEAATQPLSEEKGVRYLTTAINEVRRLVPEISNLREDIETSVKEDFIEQLFPVIDAFDRFFAHEKETHDLRIQRWLEGIRGIYNSVLMILRNHEVKEVPARGIFNPKYQAAVGTEINNDLPPGTILRTERRGFIMGKKILRTPEVIISKRNDLVG